MQFLLHGRLLIFTHASDTSGISFQDLKKLIKDLDNKVIKDIEDIEDIKDRNYLKPVSCIASSCWSLTPRAT